MRYIRDILNEAQREGRVVISFEFFTPKTQEAEERFQNRTLPALMELEPDFCSVTYGAGGSTRGQTLEWVDYIQRRFGVPTMAHLTCVGSSRRDIHAWLQQARSRNIRNILALRGDPPQDTDRFEPSPDGFRYAIELVQFIRRVDDFCIGVAGFPEGHLECQEGKYVDWQRLRDKIQAGADFVITQLFFDNQFYYEFRDYLTQQLDVHVPLIPGIIPILSTKQIHRFATLCGASIPTPLEQRFRELEDDDEAVRAFGIEYATRQCQDLWKHGVWHFHFYTLNRVYSIRKILENLGWLRRRGRTLPSS